MYTQITAERSYSASNSGHNWETLLSSSQVEPNLRSGEALFCEGDDADFVYEILSGTVCSYSLLPDGRRQVTGFACEGEIVGLGDHEYFQTSCDALGAVRVRSIPRSRLMKVAEERPELGVKLLKCATSQLASMQEHFVLLGRKSAMEKVASFVLIFARRFGGRDADEITFSLPMTRADIADYLGLTIETVSRSFTKLRAAGVIDLPQSNIVRIRDMFELEGLANAEDESF